ncbi:hypothetical protein KKG31_03155 [Patescibacteria group bacterium]|nr:hypothetical protein [Patescibacteria group bacterium]MBU1758156.1 hypothetical protein [Patescibacteria group bacterium]
MGSYLGFLGSDAMILGIVLFLIFFNMFIGSKLIKIICNVVNVFLLLLFAVDTVVLYYFKSRLSIFDLYTFSATAHDTYFTPYII